MGGWGVGMEGMLEVFVGGGVRGGAVNHIIPLQQ